MDRILKQYTESRFFREILEEYDPLAIYVTGSRSVGLNSDRSDYDLCILVGVDGKPSSAFPDNFLQFIHKETGACIHYFTRGLDELFANKGEGRIPDPKDEYLWKATVEFGFGGETLYVKDDFREAWSEIIGKRRMIANASLYEMYEECGIGGHMIMSAQYGELYPYRDVAYMILEKYVVCDEAPSDIVVDRLRDIRRMDGEGISSLPVEEQGGYIDDILSIDRMFTEKKEMFEGFKEEADALYKRIKRLFRRKGE